MEISQQAFRISISYGVIKGIVYGIIPFPVWQDKPISTISAVFLVTIAIGVLGEYYLFYKPNMNAHTKLIEFNNTTYLKKMEITLEEIGLRKMLQKHWFIKELKEYQKK